MSVFGESILANGHKLTLAMPKSLTSRERLIEAGCGWLPHVEWIDWKAGKETAILTQASELLARMRADTVFFACLDEIASAILRRAALGWRPPTNLRRKLSGLYVRPKPLDPDCQIAGPNALLKRLGWNALDRGGWFDRVFVLDERLPAHPQRKQSNAKLRFMPEPCDWPRHPAMTRSEARRSLGIPEEAVVFLQYGLGTRRKGLHHVISAWKALPADSRAFLIVAGYTEPVFHRDLEVLQEAKRAKLLLRYITRAEEATVFIAADIILLAYVNHYGSSNVLSRAAAAGRMVLASDRGLIGYRVSRYQLGVLCAHDDPESLRCAVVRLASCGIEENSRVFTEHLKAFAGLSAQDKIIEALKLD